MTSISGINANAGIKITSTWGAAATIGSGNKLPAKYNETVDVQELQPSQIGSGLAMETSVTRGSKITKLTIDAPEMGYGNGCDVVLAQFMGTAAAPTEATPTKGDYVHTLQFNPTINTKYLTAAWQTDNGNVREIASLGIDSIVYKTSGVPGFMGLTATSMGDNLYVTGGSVAATNTYSGLASATIRDQERVCAHAGDTFWINSQSGAGLLSTNALAIIGFELNLSRPQKLVGEIKGSDGFNPPIQDDLFQGTLKITCRELIDSSFFVGWQNEAQYKAQFIVQGSQISAGSTNRTVAWYFPCMELVKYPDNKLNAPGQNPVVYEFRLLKASANPTGMTDVYPYCKITNTLATSLLA